MYRSLWGTPLPRLPIPLPLSNHNSWFFLAPVCQGSAPRGSVPVRLTSSPRLAALARPPVHRWAATAVVERSRHPPLACTHPNFCPPPHGHHADEADDNAAARREGAQPRHGGQVSRTRFCLSGCRYHALQVIRTALPVPSHPLPECACCACPPCLAHKGF